MILVANGPRLMRRFAVAPCGIEFGNQASLQTIRR